jgi:transcriptional regulator with XRE-family HTH domain
MPTPKRRVRHAAIVQFFAERLRSIRVSRDMTQRELAGQAQVTLSYISRLEAGGAAPGIDLLERLAHALRVSVIDLLPAPTAPESVDAHREQVRQQFELVLRKSGRDALVMLDGLLSNLAESPATIR